MMSSFHRDRRVSLNISLLPFADFYVRIEKRVPNRGATDVSSTDCATIIIRAIEREEIIVVNRVECDDTQ